eukprot:GCRY01006458.1.p1 GENE.GCRY01006458.1~~GCRY01006458.1.p1  ORF type:complete len:618 (+),score=79.33 GCRY01006458.1:151-2004(+)
MNKSFFVPRPEKTKVILLTSILAILFPILLMTQFRLKLFETPQLKPKSLEVMPSGELDPPVCSHYITPGAPDRTVDNGINHEFSNNKTKNDGTPVSTLTFPLSRSDIDTRSIHSKDNWYPVFLNHTNQNPSVDFHYQNPCSITNKNTQAVIYKYKDVLSGMSFLAPRMDRVLKDTFNSPSNYTQLGGKRLNVHFLLVDMVSRDYFLKDMPAVNAYLRERDILNPDRKNGTVFTTVDFKGLSVHGRNSPWNQIPIVSGQPYIRGYRDNDIKYQYKGKAEKPITGQSLFDVYKKQGFATAYDCADPLSIFSVTEPIAHMETQPFFGWWLDQKMWIDYRLDEGTFYGRDQSFQLNLDFATRFNRNYADRPKFVFTKIVDAHEHTHSFLKKMDNEILDYVANIEQKLDTDHHVVVLMADHGAHYGYHRRDFYPNEHKNPFFVVLFPEGMLPEAQKEQIMTNLMTNIERPLSMFDVFATVRDLAGMFQPSVVAALRSQFPVATGIDGRSVFEEIPDRSCAAMGVEDWFCSYREFHRVSGMIDGAWKSAAKEWGARKCNANEHDYDTTLERSAVYLAEPVKLGEKRLVLVAMYNRAKWRSHYIKFEVDQDVNTMMMVGDCEED